MKMIMTFSFTFTLSFSFSFTLTFSVDSYFTLFCLHNIIMSYYWCNRQEILQEAKKRYSKEKAAEYYQQNREVIKEKSRSRYKNMSEEEDKIKEYQKRGIKN